jgi:hypothetical protein
VFAHFPVAYVADWDDLAAQRAGTQGYQVGTWDISGTYRQNNGGASLGIINTNDYGPIGQCYYGWADSGKRSTSGWAAPDDVAAAFQAMDPLVLPTDDSYEPRLYANLYGSRHPNITTGTADKTIGQRFIIKEAGVKCYGVEFYTHDAGSWTAKCSLWAPDGSQLATTTVACTGQGLYQALFSSPLTITDAHMARQVSGANEQFSVGIYNNTNTNYTHSTTTTQILPWDYQSMMMSWHMNERAAAWVASDARPNAAHASEIYPVSPLISRN